MPVSFCTSVASGIAAAYAIHQNLKCLSIIPRELRSLSDECSRLEKTLKGIYAIRKELEHLGLVSKSRLDPPVLVRNLHRALVDAHTRLSDLQSFIKYMSEKAQENTKGDHWHWIRKKNNIDRLRAELRSIRYDLTVCCSNASPEQFYKDIFMEQHTGKEAIQFRPQLGATFSLHCAKTDDRFASHEVWSQLYQEYQHAEWMSAYRQRPQVQEIQIPDHSEFTIEPGTCPTTQEPSSTWHGLLYCSCIRRRLPSSLASTLRLGRICSSIRTCYVLVALGIFSIAGSLALALWRTINHNDIQGGFSSAQYILAVGALIIGCVLVLHSRVCSCWYSTSSTDGNGTLSQGRLIELQQPG